MLPNVKTMKSSAIAALLALSLAVPAAPAFAWGQREQDVLKGVLGTLAVTAIIKEANKNRAQPQQKYYYVDPQPQQQHYNGRGNGRGKSHYSNGNGYGHQKPTYSHNQGYTNVYNTAAAQAFNSYSHGERQAIQRRLARQGYYSGGIDGSFGPGTYRAIAAYARDTGNLDRLASRNGAFAVYDGLIF